MQNGVLAVVPARSGSKSIPDKNILSYKGKPMLAHSIDQARKAQSIDRVIVSTDSEVYAKIAIEFGAEVPFLRPAGISGNLSTDLEVFLHALHWLKDNENYSPQICVHLRPTYPNRRVEDIDRAVQLLLADPSFDSVRSVTVAPETPFKTWFMNPDESLVPVIASDIPEAYNLPRQALPVVYMQNACIDVVRTKVILEKKSMTGSRIRGFVMQEYHDIDEPDQMRKAFLNSKIDLHDKRIVFDIDGIIATLTPENDYNLAKPIPSAIGLINRLYDAGNTIILFTARGSASGRDWRQVTESQMRQWGVKFHELLFQKPHADFYVDDRLITINELRRLMENSDREI